MKSGMVAAAKILLVVVLTAAAPASSTEPTDLVPGTFLARGTTIREAWFAGATTRYDHFARGNRVEGSVLRVRLTGGTDLALRLPEDLVFEDSRPRLYDLDGDGSEDIVVVVSSLRQGASLAVVAVTPQGLAITAQSPYVGRPHRWLNPAGIADFDGDGRAEIAIVAMPHLEKRLEIWRPAGGALVRVATLPDASNHRLGSAHTGMAIVADVNNDGIADLAIPNGSRMAIRFITMAGGDLREIARVGLAAPADGDLAIAGGKLLVPLEDGSTASIALPVKPLG